MGNETQRLNYRDGHDLAEVRLVSSSHCRDNGWRDDDGSEQWDRVKTWSVNLVGNNIGYGSSGLQNYLIRMLYAGKIPSDLEGLGCLSDTQFNAINTLLSKGGKVWLGLPFGTHDEKGYKRDVRCQ